MDLGLQRLGRRFDALLPNSSSEHTG